MTSQGSLLPAALQDAVEDFRQADGVEDLWARLRKHVGRFSVSNVQYGFGAFPEGKPEKMVILDAFVPGYLDAKLRDGLLEHDAFVQAGMTETQPLIWSDTSRLADLSAEARRSLEVDWDLGVTTGVSIPLRFLGGLGGGLIGLHAADLSWAEFDRLWNECGRTMTAISHAFDAALRRDHMSELFPLDAEERECLLRLAAGFRPKQIADHLRLTDKQVERRLTAARIKLRASTTTQAVANAVIFGMIDP